MAKIHDLFIIELAEVIKGYGNDPDVEDPFRLSEFYRFYELPNIAVSRENFEKMRPAQPEQRWIPFKTRPLTKAEKEEHPEWDCILDCKLPDNGQRILVNVSVRGHESVQYDEFYTDDGSYLDSGYEIGTEATAWMPLPEPYDAESEDEE